VGLEELTSRDAVLQAIEEFDRLGRGAFLGKYAYGGAKRYRIVHGGREYDLKAIAGAAFGYQHPDHGPLGLDEFGSGLRSTVPKLESLGFEVHGTAATEKVDVPLDLVLKWSPSRNPETIELHREVAEQHGAVWWGRVAKDPSKRGMSERKLKEFADQLARGEETLVFLHGNGSTWRTRLLAITLDEADVEQELVPPYYDPATHHSLWVKIADFESIDTAELTQGFVVDSTGDPVDAGSLGNQGPLFVRRRSSGSRPLPPPPAVTGHFDVEAVRDRAQARGLLLSDRIYRQVVAALESGKHIILTGPPGTAKTTLAQVVVEVAAAAGRCKGYLPTTATADWTTFETIGGLKPTASQTLEFEAGHFLAALEKDEWLLIDELNRSNFDRAFGQLFTVLSGQPVVLPYARGAGGAGPIVLLPEGSSSPVEHGDVLRIPRSWRIVATMNVFDKTLLFEMSFALMRRFAFIEVPSPGDTVFNALIEREAGEDPRAADLAKLLLSLRELKDLGPAVYMDIARYLDNRISIADGETDGQLLFEAFYSYLLPQFEGIDSREGEALFKQMAALVGSSELRERLRKTLNAVLGLALPAPGGGTDEALEAP
jgi:MoxR-like ATPase